MWPVCEQVEELEISSGCLKEMLISGIQEHMPCLQTVMFGCVNYDVDYINFSDDDMADLLAASTSGWKIVHCCAFVSAGLNTFDA
jgi:hypothetical protein